MNLLFQSLSPQGPFPAPSLFSLFAAYCTIIAVFFWLGRNIAILWRVIGSPDFPGLPQASWRWQILFTVVALIALWIMGRWGNTTDLKLGFAWNGFFIGFLTMFLALRESYHQIRMNEVSWYLINQFRKHLLR